MDSSLFLLSPLVLGNTQTERINKYQIFYFTKGNGTIQIDFDTYDIKGPSLYFISEYQLLKIVACDDDLQGKVIRFANDFFCIKLNRSETFCDAVIFNSQRPPFVQLDSASKNKIDFIFQGLENEILENNGFQEEIITSQLKTLLLTASGLKLDQGENLYFSGLSSLVTNFQDLLENKFRLEHQVKYYANALHITPKGLNNAVKKELAKNASELIKEKLIIEAKRELYQQRKSVKEIAYELGFEDPAYFNRFFKKSTGRTPLAFLEA